ncbi:AF4/FMR2 family member 2 isoform X2 [Protopterus annectens]|uniref:AF4/FMR2 family member 2 isoform X2 n=1 Tax=Protopterus annectens TaxID=7888 RepID=UPI001CFAC0EF|nr:AF4/FMR2 family member 2 isoform X2 [Protopterus annectens]
MDLSHYEQERSILKRRERERRTQEVQQDDDLIAAGLNLFSEPYKTSKEDALANLVQNALGNYDEMKDLLTSNTDQSHLIGIPKNSVSQTPTEKTDLIFFSEQRNILFQLLQNTENTFSTMPLQSTVSSNTSSHNHQTQKKSRNEWTQSNLSSSNVHWSQSNSHQNRAKHNEFHDLQQDPCDDFFNSQKEQHKIIPQGGLEDSSLISSSSQSRRHGHSRSYRGDHSYKELTSPVESEILLHSSGSPVPSTSILSGLSTPNFPPVLHHKPSMMQQKPTAYVRPMDGQDQAPNYSPVLKPSSEIEDSFASQSLGTLLDGKTNASNAKSKLPKLIIPQAGEASHNNDSSFVEEILREMTHSWPPPLTAIHTPGKAEQTKFPIPNKESHHLISACNGQRQSEAPCRAAAKPVPQKSMLEDDLKLSSDEDEREENVQETNQRSIPVNCLPVQVAPGVESVHSSVGRGSSSDSETTSGSDSDSETSSSDSACNGKSHGATPEPEPPTNNWQLDKWLNKVTSHKSTINRHGEDHTHSALQSESRQDTSLHNKVVVNDNFLQSDSKEILPVSPIKDKTKPRLTQKIQETKCMKQTSPSHDEVTTQCSTVSKQPKKVERISGIDEYVWPKPNASSSPSSETEVRTSGDASKVWLKGSTCKTLPPKVWTTAGTISDKRKHRGPSKNIAKTCELLDTDVSSDTASEEEKVSILTLVPTYTGAGISAKNKNSSSDNISVSCLTCNNTSFTDQINSDAEELLFSPAAETQTKLHSPLREFEEIKYLWVKIDLSLLSRIPGQKPNETISTKDDTQITNSKHRCQPPVRTGEKASSKPKWKHKAELLDVLSENKKQCLENDSTVSCSLLPCIRPLPNKVARWKETTLKKTTKKREEKLHVHPLSPALEEPVLVKQNTKSTSFSHESTSRKSLENTVSILSSLSCKYRKNEKSVCHTNGVNPQNEDDSCNIQPNSLHNNSETETSIPCTEPLLPVQNLEDISTKLTFDDKLHGADYYMQEAKKLKHKADALLEKFGKAVNYADAALSFIECGNAMERDPLEAKSPYTMYSETVELISYRCLGLLYFRMFKLKKDHAMKYSKLLTEYFKNSSKTSQAPSPWESNGKITGPLSPSSLTASPISSAGSNTITAGYSSSAGAIAVPQRIHHMAASHINITNNLLHSHEHWDTADKLTRENKEFFEDLDTEMGPLTQQSSMTSLVRYVRQGLHWLRTEGNIL